MAGSKTAYGASAILGWFCGGVAVTVPATWYFALSTAPFDPSVSTVPAEMVGGGYARAAMPNNNDVGNFIGFTPGWPASTVAGTVWFGPPSGAAWPPPASVYLCDAASDGHAWYGADLSGLDPAGILVGQTFYVGAGTLVFRER